MLFTGMNRVFSQDSKSSDSSLLKSPPPTLVGRLAVFGQFHKATEEAQVLEGGPVSCIDVLRW